MQTKSGSLSVAQCEKPESQISLVYYEIFLRDKYNVPNPSVRAADDISVPLIVLRTLCMDPSEGTILGRKPFNFGIQWEYLAVGFIRPE